MLLVPVFSISWAEVYDAEEMLRSSGLGKVSLAARANAIERLAEKCEPGDALLLPRTIKMGEVDLTALPDNVSVHYGTGGTIYMGGYHRDMFFAFNENVDFVPYPKGMAKNSATKARFDNSKFLRQGKIAAGGTNNQYLSIEAARGDVVIDLANTDLIHCAGLYIWYENNNNAGPYVSIDGVNASNSRFYSIIEHNYGESATSVLFRDVTGPFFWGNSDTESSASDLENGVYQIMNCQDLSLVCARNFHSHGARIKGPLGYKIYDGRNINLIGFVDIGDNQFFSMIAKKVDNLRIFGGFFEDAVLIDSCDNMMLAGYTPQGFGPTVPAGEWKTPPYVENEIVFEYKDFRIDRHTTETNLDAPAFEIPQMPDIPSVQLGDFSGRQLGKVSAAWGKTLVNRGADPTGRTSSSRAIAEAISNEDVVEFPAGEILISEPIVFTPGLYQNDKKLIGAPGSKTRIRTTGNFPAIVIDYGRKPVGKTRATSIARLDLQNYDFDGGNNTEYAIKIIGSGEGDADVTDPAAIGGGFANQGGLVYNCSFRNYTKAAVIIGSGSIAPGDSAGSWDGYDQHQWIHCTFENTGDYGIYNDVSMIDKNIYVNCVFKDLKKAGLAMPSTHMFEASTISGCRFENIDGPGVWMAKSSMVTNILPGPASIQDCQFIECGNEERAALDWGYTKQGLVLNTKIVIKTKAWKYGFIGAGQVMNRCTVDVDMSKAVEGAKGFAFRQTRRFLHARLQGNYIARSWSNAPMGFVDDAEGEPGVCDLAECPGYNDDYVYAWPNLFQECTFGQDSLGYILINTDRQGNIVSQIPFKGAMVDTRPRSIPGPTGAKRAVSSQVFFYDLRGRIVGNSLSKDLRHKQRTLPTGVYIEARDRGPINKVLRK